MADKLAAYDRNGLRVVHHIGGWRIDVRTADKLLGIDVGAQQFANDGALSVSLFKLNNKIAHAGFPREPITVDDVRSHSGALA